MFARLIGTLLVLLVVFVLLVITQPNDQTPTPTAPTGNNALKSLSIN
jgi:competence protein ComGC